MYNVLRGCHHGRRCCRRRRRSRFFVDAVEVVGVGGVDGVGDGVLLSSARTAAPHQKRNNEVDRFDREK